MQQVGLNAELFNTDPAAIWSFQSAVAAMMPGVYPDEITINLVISLYTINGTQYVQNQGVNQAGTNGVRRLNAGESIEDGVEAPLGNQVNQPRYLQASNSTGNSSTYNPYGPIPSGIGLNYNVTIHSIERLGYNDPALCFQTLSTQLIEGVKNGNFTSALAGFVAALNVTILPSASSSAADFVFLRDFVYVGTPMMTNPPSSYPTTVPSGPTSQPSLAKHSVSPTAFVPKSIYFDIGIGVTLACCAFYFVYMTSVVTAALRRSPDWSDALQEQQKAAALDKAKTIMSNSSFFSRLETLGQAKKNEIERRISESKALNGLAVDGDDDAVGGGFLDPDNPMTNHIITVKEPDSPKVLKKIYEV